MKTARFSEVVEKCGRPAIHIVLMDPAKDRILQSAVKGNRVMTIFQQAVGTKADRGVVGFDPGGERQFLIFPKSLSPFEGRSIIGIKYELLKEEDLPRSTRGTESSRREPKRRRTKTEKAPPPANVVAFRRDADSEERGEPRKEERSQDEPAADEQQAVETDDTSATLETGEPDESPDESEVAAGESEQAQRENVKTLATRDEIARIRKEVRKAMKVLEQGKHVAAFNILKLIVDT